MNTIVVEQQSLGVVVVENTGQVLEIVQEVPSVVSIAEQGPMGPSGNGDKTFEQDFAGLSIVTVTHNLGKYPSVTVIDSAGDECEGAVDHQSINQLTVTFSAPFNGSVICN